MVFVDDNAESCNLVFDASGVRNTEEATELYQFFHNHLSKLPRCGRVVMIGQQPNNIDCVEHAIAQRGLVGFVKSVAKEIGRKGATANLIYLNGFGHKGLAAPLRFLLSAGCAYTNGQVVNVSTPVTEGIVIVSLAAASQWLFNYIVVRRRQRHRAGDESGVGARWRQGYRGGCPYGTGAARESDGRN